LLALLQEVLVVLVLLLLVVVVVLPLLLLLLLCLARASCISGRASGRALVELRARAR